MSYLMRYKGKYRLKAPYDISTNQFPRKLNGNYEDIDVYIECQKGVQIFYYGKGILEVYIPSIGRANNIIKAIQDDLNDDILFDLRKYDGEASFKFNSKNMELLEKYLKPKTSGANISPFSTKNLPKNKSYKIPDDDLIQYNNIINKIPEDKKLDIAYYTRTFIKSLISKKNTWDMIKSDMAIKGLKGKLYIHAIGKWNEYINYLNDNFDFN